MTDTADIIVIGAGMAGASAAASMAEEADVVLLEQEDRPGVHATGRSAALFSATYGNATVRALSRASWRFLKQPPEDFTDTPLVSPRGCLFCATPAQAANLSALEAAEPYAFQRMDEQQARELVSCFRPGILAGGLFEAGAADIDVNALHRSYLRRFKLLGGRLLCGERVRSIVADGKSWRVRTDGREWCCGVLVNAAGAWGDQVAESAGIASLGLQPKRRTAALIEAPAAPKFATWPTVIDIDEQFYFKPDAGRLLVSPADETAVEPHDAYPDDEMLAAGIERIEALTTIEVRKAPRAWAGLRTFAPDRTPVVGFQPSAGPPFLQLVGQGGYGIQTAPAMAALAASLVSQRAPPEYITPQLLAALSPARFGA